ncbi:DNA-dependent ATPase fun30, partial [Coemansia aciculifera]
MLDMPEPSSEPLAPSTPEYAQCISSQSSTTAGQPDLDDLVVLESSPNRPGSSRTARLKDLTQRPLDSSAVPTPRLSSIYFRGKQAQQLLGTAASNSTTGRGTPVTSAAIDFTRMDISSNSAGGKRLTPADFGKALGQFKWNADETISDSDNDAGTSSSSRKRLVSELDSPEHSVCKRSTPVSVLSDNDDDDVEVVASGPPRRGRLLRGSRPAASASATPDHPPSSPLLTCATTTPRRTLTRRPAPAIEVESDDEGDDAGNATEGFQRSFDSIEPHVMQLFNLGSDSELMEKTGATPEEVAIVRGLRPFADMDAVESLLRKTRGVRLAIFNQYRDAVLGHAEVEAVISQCAGIFSKLKAAMKSAGVESNEATGALSIAEGIALAPPRMISTDFTLKHYQLEGVQWLDCLRNANASGILADEMGLGKTFQVIAFLCKGIEEARVRGPSMVVCPS